MGSIAQQCSFSSDWSSKFRSWRSAISASISMSGGSPSMPPTSETSICAGRAAFAQQGKLLLNDTCTPATMDSEDERIAHLTGSRRKNMVNKLLSALLTSLCLCLLLAFMEYTPGHERDEHICSKVKRYFMQVGLFTLAGITVALIFLLMNSGNVLHRVFDLDRYLIFIIPSLLFYHISLVIRFINRKRKRHHDPLF